VPERVILVVMETILSLGIIGFVIVGATLGIVALVAMIRAPYRK
jgi:hypothetical protein